MKINISENLYWNYIQQYLLYIYGKTTIIITTTKTFNRSRQQSHVAPNIKLYVYCIIRTYVRIMFTGKPHLSLYVLSFVSFILAFFLSSSKRHVNEAWRSICCVHYFAHNLNIHTNIRMYVHLNIFYFVYKIYIL